MNIKKIIPWIFLGGLWRLPIKQLWLAAKIVKKARKDSAIKTNSFTTQLYNFAKEGRKNLTYLEYYILNATVELVDTVKGDIAEVGVYRGGSAKIILGATKKQVHLFDTFEGLPQVSGIDQIFKEGEYRSSYDELKNYLKDYPNVHIYRGRFPQSGEGIKNKTFSFVHLDVDLYESTLGSLQFLYPRMNKGGIIISHDYTYADGVKKAFADFFKDKLEPVFVPLPEISYCFVVKR